MQHIVKNKIGLMTALPIGKFCGAEQIAAYAFCGAGNLSGFDLKGVLC